MPPNPRRRHFGTEGERGAAAGRGGCGGGKRGQQGQGVAEGRTPVTDTSKPRPRTRSSGASMTDQNAAWRKDPSRQTVPASPGAAVPGSITAKEANRAVGPSVLSLGRPRSQTWLTNPMAAAAPPDPSWETLSRALAALPGQPIHSAVGLSTFSSSHIKIHTGLSSICPVL